MESLLLDENKLILTEVEMEAVWGTSRPQAQGVDGVVAIARNGGIVWHSKHNLRQKKKKKKKSSVASRA